MKNIKQLTGTAVLAAGVALGANPLFSKDNDSETNNLTQSQNTSVISTQVKNILHSKNNIEQKLKIDTIEYICNNPDLRKRVYGMQWMREKIRWNPDYSWLQIQKFIKNIEEIDLYLSANPWLESTLKNVKWWESYIHGKIIPSDENWIFSLLQTHKVNQVKIKKFPELIQNNIIESIWYKNNDPTQTLIAIFSIENIINWMNSNLKLSQTLAYYGITLDVIWRDDPNNMHVWMWKTLNLILSIEGLKSSLSPQSLMIHSVTIAKYEHGDTDLENIYWILSTLHHSEDKENY